MSYKHVIITEFGGPEVMRVVEEDALPEPAPGQVRVKVLAAGTGFTDTIIRQGQYMDVKDKPPFTLGYDWVGEVDAQSEGVTYPELGQRVADMPAIGGYTQYLCVDAGQVVPVPNDVDPAEAVCMILPYTTAYQMLTRIRALPEGASILVHAAAGAVGSALVELGQLLGFTVYGTASKPKHELLLNRGAIPIDYRDVDFVTEVHRLTEGRGVDAVFDTIGGRNWSRSYRCLSKQGLLVGFGALQLTTGEEKVPSLLWGFAKLLWLWPLWPDGRRSAFYNVLRRRRQRPEEFREDVATLFDWLAESKLRPVVAGRYRLADAVEVHRKIDRAELAGRAVLLCQD